ncbi:copper homeostasis protein CutC [Thalassorhabdomicrobium marinisediminis]|uniref:PF03932 family protein CutC n=1 Tax=Thalassorhabdomicrobium marinisediminis TaxID=2170577 RepID=A0A2T7FXA2_9RHOB|nr:copper homeostasis protein CutC [Thalassorhabdomicrobium marinisediminis]PVA06758.1 copper homeostasis protein CutC [Thalassorhabdomicrobium marinisediminis]
MSQTVPATLEVCIEEATALAACEAGADRIELCSALALGGLTPSRGLMEAARRSPLPVHAMIRPRDGDFEFSAAEVAVMEADIDAVRDAGLEGVVLGAMQGEGLDLQTMARLRDAAGGLACTLHRAIDLMPDPFTALEQVIDLGFVRVLTSGGARQACDGLGRLAALQEVAGGRIEIMAGSGLTPDNVARVADRTGIRSFHASCAVPLAVADNIAAFGFAAASRKRTDASAIAAMKAALAPL